MAPALRWQRVLGGLLILIAACNGRGSEAPIPDSAPPADAAELDDLRLGDSSPPDSNNSGDGPVPADKGPADAAPADQGGDADQGPPATTQPFTDTFKAKANIGSLCTKSSNIVGHEPLAAGSYPVFIWTPGTGGTSTAVTASTLTAEMATRGFVAAAVDYSTLANLTNMTCAQVQKKATCVYSPSKANSAVSKLCARARADCTKGIVVAGLSQGSFMAMIAKDYDARVRAAYVLGAGNDQSTPYFDNMSACLDAGYRKLPGDRLRAVNGESDGNWPPMQKQLEAITGNSCTSGSTQCFRANGSGWYIVKGSQVQDGTADHCYQVMGGCSNNKPMDGNYTTKSEPWTMKTNLDWLATFTD